MPLRHDHDCSCGSGCIQESSGGSSSSGSRQTSSSYFSLSSSPFTQPIKTTTPASLPSFASPSSPGTEPNLETHYSSASSSSSPSPNPDPTNAGQDPETTILAQEPQNEEPEPEPEPRLASSRTSLQRSYREAMTEHSQDKIEEAHSQIESEQLSTEAEEEELARMMATSCLADEIHTVDINGQQKNRDNLLEVNVVPYSARPVRPSTEGDIAMIKLESMFVNPVVHGSTSASTAANSSSVSTGNSSSTPIPSGSISTPREKQSKNETETEYQNNLPISKLSQLRHQYPHHFQMCEYYTAAASYAERLSRSNVPITSHSQLLSNVIRARKDEAKASLKQQKRQEKEEKNRARERVSEDEKERERVKKIREKWVADVMHLGHKCVLKRGILRDAHKEAWGLERTEEAEREKEEKLESARPAWARVRAKGQAQAAERSDPRKSHHSASTSEERARERSTPAPEEGIEPTPHGAATGAQAKGSLLDRVRGWRSGDARARQRVERARRSHEKLEMWERRWLEEHPGYVSDWDDEGDERREGEGEGDGDGDGWVGGRGMWEGF